MAANALKTGITSARPEAAIDMVRDGWAAGLVAGGPGQGDHGTARRLEDVECEDIRVAFVAAG
jgi:hypothetical protein